MKNDGATILVYELEKDAYGNGKSDEEYRGEFDTSKGVIDWLEKQMNTKVSRQNINRAIRKGYVVLDKFLVFRVKI